MLLLNLARHSVGLPPCTQKIIEKKVKRVVIGTLDPNPDHAGRAVKILEKHGIEVTTNILPERCWSLNPGFFKWISLNKTICNLKDGYDS